QANGNTRDRQGRLISCEHESRRVTRTEKDGSITVLADTFSGRRFNSPNDVVVTSTGSILFTDPTYGLPKGQKQEMEGKLVFEICPDTPRLSPLHRNDPLTRREGEVLHDLEMPNGLGFSPDERLFYIADSGKPHHIVVYDVVLVP